MIRALFLSAAILASNLVPQRAGAQERLDTGRIAFGTRVVRTIGPSSADNWEFVRTRDLEVDRLGQMWVLEDTDHKLRVFSADGKLLQALGGNGAGPGEFQRPRWLQRLGDTVWVYDPSTARLSPFSVTTRKLLPATRPGAPHFGLEALSPVGSFIAAGSHQDDPSPEKPLTTTFSHQVFAQKQQRALGQRTVTQRGVQARM